MPSPHHATIEAEGFQRSAADFVLVTDGSGHPKLGGGGWCALLLNEGALAMFLGLGDRPGFLVTGGTTESSVDRMEFRALLDGLALIERKLAVSKYDLALMTEMPTLRRRVYWMTDRENLALSVARKQDGSTYYGRNNARDLWASFEYFERMFVVQPHFCTKADHVAALELCDRHASACRQIFVSYQAANNAEQYHT